MKEKNTWLRLCKIVVTHFKYLVIHNFPVKTILFSGELSLKCTPTIITQVVKLILFTCSEKKTNEMTRKKNIIDSIKKRFFF
jgi:hypothetical protein